jgi:transcriptional regulator with XRE-family HTH domain
MMSNKENFKALVSKEKTNTVERNRERIKNRAYLRESQGIALKVLDKLDELGWSQVRLANEMSVTPQQITKIVSGKENLTIETQIKIQNILDIPILASYYETRKNTLKDLVLKTEKKYNVYETVSNVNTVSNYHSGKLMKLNFNSISENYSFYESAM